MAKKKNSPQKKFPVPLRSARRKYIAAGVLALMATLVLGTAVGPWRNTLGAKQFRALFVTAPPPPIPSKEYIYAGGRLVATEEPAVLFGPLAAPNNLTATTFSESRIDITWSASPNADHYQIERTTSLGVPYMTVFSSVNTTSINDSTVSPASGYLYRVRAVSTSGHVSPPSTIDLATAVTFLNDPLIVGVTEIKAEHILELRRAVDTVRVMANLSAVTWTDNSLLGLEIKAVHIEELREHLDDALSALGLPMNPYTHSPPFGGKAIKKEDIEQLRERLK